MMSRKDVVLRLENLKTEIQDSVHKVGVKRNEKMLLLNRVVALSLAIEDVERLEGIENKAKEMFVEKVMGIKGGE